MVAKLWVACPRGHSHSVSLGMPNLEILNSDEEIISFEEEKCPECGEGPLTAPGGFYEKDASDVMRRTGDYRPDVAGVR